MVDSSISNEQRESIQFRRQVIAGISGAMISLVSAGGLAFFQYMTQSRNRRFELQLQALGEFRAALYGIAFLQAKLHKLISDAARLQSHARRVLDNNRENEYEQVNSEAKQLGSAYFEYLTDETQPINAIFLAYQKLQVAFDDVPPLDLPVPQFSDTATIFVWGGSGEATKDNVQNVWNSLTRTDMQSLSARYQAQVKWANQWKSNLDVLTQHVAKSRS